MIPQMQISSQLEKPQHCEAKEVYNCYLAEMQSAVNKHSRPAGSSPRNLTDLRRGESGIIDRLDLPVEEARRLMEMGFLPGHAVTPAHAAPGGDPRVFRVDGSEVALRRETARHLILRQEQPPKHKT
jgi:ferrous iron transport protein A